MSSENKICAICLGVVQTGQGQAIFTAECSHTFHFGCISNSVNHGNYLCPVCRAKWTNLPFGQQNFFPNPAFEVPRRQPSVRRWSIVEPEPNIFSDDEPLPDGTADPSSNASSGRLQNVSIKAMPERQAVVASESLSDFSVLVGLRAPPLSVDALRAQRAPIDLITVLDVSGSMHSSSKLDLVKRAMNFVIDNLGPSDRLSIVSFSNQARRVLPLRRMTDHGREDAKRAVTLLVASGMTNIVEGLKKGVRVLEERRHQNPVASIIFLSDGLDTCNRSPNELDTPSNSPSYLHLLPASIRPGGMEDGQIFAVHSFGFGSDHDPLAMHDISDSSGGTFSFIESYEMVQDAFASCIGGLLSVVTLELRLTVRSASHGVEIKSLSSGRYASEISDHGSQGTINVGDLYADEEKEFLINISVPALANTGDERKTTLVDVTCSYKDAVSNETITIEGDLVEILRPEYVSPVDMRVNLEVDRQRNRLRAAESIAEAQRMAETGNLRGARALLSDRRSGLRASDSGQLGDNLCMWLEAEMKETEDRMGSRELYERHGRAYALSNMSAHGYQRASTRGNDSAIGSSSGMDAPTYCGYVTPNMANLVIKSRELSKAQDDMEE
ncbi:hypothetical protein ACS0TY_000670 [Phlomoides rotata]